MRFFATLLLSVALAVPAGAAFAAGGDSGSGASAFNLLESLGNTIHGDAGGSFLPPDQAFILSVEQADAHGAELRFHIADGYYLYHDKFKFSLAGNAATLGPVKVPRGTFEEDPNFGKVEINTGTVEVHLPISLKNPKTRELELHVAYQGCASGGICYPPIKKVLPLELATATGAAAGGSGGAAAGASGGAEDQGIAHMLASGATGLTLLSFFGFGLLLAFTPCVFPMVPILSGIIVGHGPKLTARRAFALSSAYVLAMAATYAVAGVVAGLFGDNLQIVFQNPWVIGGFSAVFVLLALSMFGFYRLQLPASWQSRLAAASGHQKRGTLHGAAAMGLLSALIVGPCVAPPLAGALLYIGKTGNALLGGTALFVLALGMGTPLLVIGTSAGKLLPKAGHWMVTVNRVFGVIMLGVAIYLLGRILPPGVTLGLWALLLMVCAIYLGALDRLEGVVNGWRRLFKGVGLAMLVYGGVLIVGAATGGTDVFQPLQRFTLGSASGSGSASHALAFTTVKGIKGLDAGLARAHRLGRPVMLDFYADWCVECKRMDRETFADAGVRRALGDTILLRADVTADDRQDRALLKRFGLYGPPAVLFFGPDQRERRTYRLIGYAGPAEFKKQLRKALAL